MAIPDFETMMLPILMLHKSGTPVKTVAVYDHLAKQFKLTDEELAVLQPSGRQPVFNNRAGWALTYLRKSGLLASEGRGASTITSDGLRVLAANPTRLTRGTLSPASVILPPTSPVGLGKTPQEQMDEAYHIIRETLVGEILEQLKVVPPAMFERIVVELLLKMGYGGSQEDAGQAVGRTGDGGIDGIIKEDKLGLDLIYIQAKRWKDGTVGRPDVQAFAGSLEGHRARKGVFITTSDFSKEARDYVTRIEKRIILMDGRRLATLMMDHGLGVSTVQHYELKRLDSDYFESQL